MKLLLYGDQGRLNVMFIDSDEDLNALGQHFPCWGAHTDFLKPRGILSWVCWRSIGVSVWGSGKGFDVRLEFES